MSPPARSRGRPHSGTEIMAAPPGAPVGPAKKLRPFSFPRMEKMTRAQARLLGRLDWLIPVTLLAGEVPEPVRSRLRELFEEDVRLWLDYAHLITPDRLRKVVCDPTFLAAVNPAPQGTRGVLEFDLSLAHAAIDLLLGATGTEAASLRALTEIEEGVISYVLLEALKGRVPALDPQRPRLRLERILHGVDEAAALFSEETQIAAVQFKMAIGIHPGFFRLFLPGSLLARAVPPPDSPDRRLRTQTRLARHVRRLSGLRVPLRVEIARADISAGDFAGLHAGDVVLVEDVTARPDKGEGGTARLRLGSGRAGRIDAAVSVEDGKYRLTIGAIHVGDESGDQRPVAPVPDGAPIPPPTPGGRTEPQPIPQRAMPPDEDEPTTANRPPNPEEMDVSEPGKGGAAELLNDIPMQITVELGRVPVTAEDVVALHVGQVLELNKGPGEPVDLSVNGKVVARGELVEVEGQIGVRILNISE